MGLTKKIISKLAKVVTLNSISIRQTKTVSLTATSTLVVV